eukprot:scaffold95962_cov49-Phaeocystis_antarctica.AAC.2
MLTRTEAVGCRTARSLRRVARGSFVALPTACTATADRQAFLDFAAAPAQCAQAGATGCRYNYSVGGCGSAAAAAPA